MEAESLSVPLEPTVVSPGLDRSGSATPPDGEPSSKRQKTRGSPPPRKYPKPSPHDGLPHERMHAFRPEMLMTINNASVLELWAAVVTRKLHSDVTWETCLSAGKAICGMVRDGATYHINRHRDRVKQGDALNHVSELITMRFNLVLQNDLVLVDGKPVPGDEVILKDKFATSENYKEMKEWLEVTAKAFSIDYLEERALNILDFFKPCISPGLDPWNTNTMFNCMALFHSGHEYGAEDIRWFQRKAEQEEMDFIEEERLRALEAAAAKKRVTRIKPKPTPRRETRAEAARAEAASRGVLSSKVFTTSPNPRQRRHGRRVRG
ncbi:hypothetical protein M436DRAFT_61796 [Aureobasidium namibiae CBS 147.97]|uniref:Uncharacterized protein n=1 Tax=Aureobasidium namibiae CBS 147.97 TaxID=1043004 RepID=A0A074XLE5_9PEZI